MMLLDLRLLPDFPELILYCEPRSSGAGLVSAWKEIVLWRVSEDSLAVLRDWQDGPRRRRRKAERVDRFLLYLLCKSAVPLL
jgi:hypothetical protein